MVKNIGKLFLVTFVSAFFSEKIACASDYVCELRETPGGFYQNYCAPGNVKELHRTPQRLPPKYALEITPIKDQGPLGTCASFAAGACIEYYFPTVRVSEAEFTVLAETNLPEGDCIAGLFLGNALRLAKDMGCVVAGRLTYSKYLRYVAQLNQVHVSKLGDLSEDAPICRKDPYYSSVDNYNNIMANIGVNIQLEGNSGDITPYRLGRLYPIRHISPSEGTTSINQEEDIMLRTIKLALAQNMPVAAGIDVFDDYLSIEDDQIILPSEDNHPVGGHAVMLYGYDEDRESFCLKNSWGQQWGIDGTAYMPYEYIVEHATELVAIGR